jgi:hypothetical protein
MFRSLQLTNMKTGIIILLLFITGHSAFAQRYIVAKNQPAAVTAISVAGHHTVKSRMDSACINMKKRTLLPMFASKRTVVNRFLTSYMEIEKYPFITYEASFTALEHKNLHAGDTIITKGLLTAHGVSRAVQIPIVLTRKDKQLVLYSQFKVKPVDDYKVRATSGIRYLFLNDVKVFVNAVLEEG